MKRLALLDFLRTVALVNMVTFHICYDLNVVSGRFVEWQFLPWVKLWQQAVVLCFIFVAGMSFGVRPKINLSASMPSTGLKGLLQQNKTLAQALRLLILGQIITWTTCYFMPQEAIYYGVITFLGSALLLSYMLENKHWQLLSKIPVKLGVLLSLATFAFTYHVQLGYFGLGIWHYELPTWLYTNNHAFWGFPSDDFLSADYVSFIPHIFMYVAGFYCFKLLLTKQPQLLQVGDFQYFNSAGRHSLLIYFIHQPLLLGLFWLFGLI